MITRKNWMSIGAAATCCFFLCGSATAATNAIPALYAESPLVVHLLSDATLDEVTNSIYPLVNRYRDITPDQLRTNGSLKEHYTRGMSEIFECEQNAGVHMKYISSGASGASVLVENANKTGHTIGYLGTERHRRLFMYSQAIEGKADGPYIECYATGKIRCLAWFKDGKMIKGQMWDANGKLTESRVFEPSVDILKEAARTWKPQNK